MNTFAEIIDAVKEKRLPTFDQGVRKLHIIVPEGAVMELPPLRPQPGVTVIEITQKKYSRLSLFHHHNAPHGEDGILVIRTTLEENAALESFICIAGMANTGLVLETRLIGEGSSIKERTMYFGSGEQELNMFSNTTICAPNCTAEIESKGILTERAVAQFDGNITIEKTGKKSSARLIEHTLLLSNEARMNAIPGLKIETNDVLATHAASMTRVSDEQLFYFGSRGVPERDAVRLIADGFLKSLYGGLSHTKEIEASVNTKLCTL